MSKQGMEQFNEGQELESSISMKEDYITKLESSIVELKDVNARQHTEMKLLNERLNGESRRIKSLEREDDRLQSEKAILELKVRFSNIELLFFLLVFFNLSSVSIIEIFDWNIGYEHLIQVVIFTLLEFHLRHPHSCMRIHLIDLVYRTTEK